MCTHLMSCSALEMPSIEQSTQVAAESAIGKVAIRWEHVTHSRSIMGPRHAPPPAPKVTP